MLIYIIPYLSPVILFALKFTLSNINTAPIAFCNWCLPINIYFFVLLLMLSLKSFYKQHKIELCLFIHCDNLCV